MNTEITDKEKYNGAVFYDADCPGCRRLAQRCQNVLARRGFELLPLQTPGTAARLHVTDAALFAEMHLVRADGALRIGAEAWLEISRHFWWTWPLRQAARLPAFMRFLHALYRWIARHRYCLNGACAIKPAKAAASYRWPDCLPLLLLPALSLLLRPYVANWIFMWLIAFSLYAGCKWLTYKMALRQNLHPARWRRLAYLFAYTGMNAAGFLDKKKTSPQPRAVEWLAALAKIFSGVILLYGITRHLLPVHPWSAGWTGMVGIILILHFGLFHCLALVWQQLRVDAIPLMQSPLRATSLAEFWGRRWNTGFKELSLQFLFRPLQRRANIATTTLLVFGVSGLVHDLVISLPARAGYGLPTLYFLIQGGGLISERTPFARCLGFGHGWRGCLFTLLITTGPVFFLFHPPFIHHVILPMLHVIGAT